METDSAKTNRWVFMGILAAVALAINYGFITLANSRKAAEAQKASERQAAENAAATATKAAQESTALAEKEAQETAARKAEQDAAALKAAAQAEAAAQQASEDAAAAKRKEVEDAAKRHADYLARYLNKGFNRIPGTSAVAVAVASEDGKPNQAVGSALAQHLKTSTVEVYSGFFKPEIFSDGLFNDLFNGSGDLTSKLELPTNLDGILLGKQDIQYLTNDATLQNAITAKMGLSIETLPFGGNIQGRGWTFRANGVGFSPQDARLQAEERIVQQINDATNMSLGQ